MKRKAFTLVEILVSITIFSIVILFLYNTLDMANKGNEFYNDKLVKKQEENRLKKVLFLDMVHISSDTNNSFSSMPDRERNSIVTFKTTNIYHNPFYEYVTYMVSREKNLLRIESKKKFNSKALDELFFENAYIDHFDSNITKFLVKEQGDKSIVFYIEKNNEDETTDEKENPRVFFRYIKGE